jgi:ABC-type microcin C transport system duplicated ATPase subunit YejF
MADPILSASGFHVRFATPDGEVHAVRNVSFDVEAGECLGVVGESGSGKSQLFLAALGLLSSNGRTEGSLSYRGRDLTSISAKERNRIRGAKITMIFQDPLTSLTPHMRVGEQIVEALRTHLRMTRAEAVRRATESLELVRIPDAHRRMRQYPHGLRPRRPDRGRADDGARRHRAGADPRHHARPQEHAEDFDRAHQPRHGRDRRDGGSGPGHASWRVRGVRPGQ